MKIVIKATIAAASTMNAEHYQKQDTAESSHSGVVFTQSASQLTTLQQKMVRSQVMFNFKKQRPAL